MAPDLKPNLASLFKETRALIDRLRGLAPHRELTYGESVQVARVQASRLRMWVGGDELAINLVWLLNQRAVPVQLVASHKLGEESGLTTNHIGGKLQVFINESEPHVRQRFSLLHEFKHVLDFEDADRLHAKLGSGNTHIQHDAIERIANEFAAHVLMPTALVKRHWFMTQNKELMATMFNVSVEAMTMRLERLGLIGQPKIKPRLYFRRSGVMSVVSLCPAA
jgi:hypothetical protein